MSAYRPEFTLFENPKEVPHRLADIIKVDPTKKRSVMVNMAVQLTPILEKGLVDPAIVHRHALSKMESEFGRSMR